MQSNRDEMSEAQQVEMSRDVPANTPLDSPDVVKREMPFDGRIVSIVVGWSNGSNNLVGVQIRRGNGDVIFPANREDDYVAANDFTAVLPLRKEISIDEELQAVYVNNDLTNSHFINLILNVEEI